jgi:WhiB family redox-sensing transcriptional regulator
MAQPASASISSPDFSEHGDPPCSQADPEMFFPVESVQETLSISVKGNPHYKVTANYHYEAEAKKICASCPYRFACLEYALSDYTLTGIWGGKNERQRAIIRRQNRSRTS